MIQRRWSDPFGEEAGSAAIRAGGLVEFGAAMGTGALVEKNIERAAAFAALPEFSDGRGTTAGGTKKPIAAGQFVEPGEHHGETKTVPAVQ